MKSLVKQFWNEPAVALHALNAALQVAQLLTIHNEAINAILVAVGAGLFGSATRSATKPVRR